MNWKESVEARPKVNVGKVRCHDVLDATACLCVLFAMLAHLFLLAIFCRLFAGGHSTEWAKRKVDTAKSTRATAPGFPVPALFEQAYSGAFLSLFYSALSEP